MDELERQRRAIRRRLVDEVRELERGLESGQYEMVLTRLLLERHVADPSHRRIANSIPELERANGRGYVLADGRTIADLTPRERATLIEFEVEQPMPVEPAPAEC